MDGGFEVRSREEGLGQVWRCCREANVGIGTELDICSCWFLNYIHGSMGGIVGLNVVGGQEREKVSWAELKLSGNFCWVTSCCVPYEVLLRVECHKLG